MSRLAARWLVALVTGALAAGSAAGEPGNLQVSLGLTRGAGAEACITAHELAQRVEQRLGHATFVSAARADLFVDAQVARGPAGWRATVTASRADGARVGVRRLASPGADCRALDDDLVLVVALVIDPRAPASPPPAAATARTIYVAVPGPAVAPRWGFGARLAGAVLAGRLPGATLAIDGALAVAPPGAWPIELGVLATRGADADDGGHGAAVRLVLGTLAVCPALAGDERAGVQLCAGGAAGAIAVHPRGLAPATGGDHATGELFGRARGAARLAGPVRAVLELGATLPLTRVRLRYDALDPGTLQVVRHEVYAEPAVAWLASLGLAVSFP